MHLNKLFIILCSLYFPMAIQAGSGKVDWPCASHDLEGTHYQSSEQVLRDDNVHRLYVKWFKGGITLTSAPSVDGGKIYYGDTLGIIHSASVEDGAILWNSKIGAGNITSSPTLDGDVLYTTCPLTQPNPKDPLISHLVAVKRKSGSLIWQSYAEGGDPLPQFDHAPIAIDDLVFVGSSSREAFETKPEYRFQGGIYAFEEDAGFLKWRYFFADTKTGDGAGTGTCSTASLDTDLGYLYVTTGHAYAEPASKHTCALLCLNYQTDKRDGELVWKHQFDEKGVWSSKNPKGNFWGVNGSPLLFKGGSKKLVGICDNQYSFHALDRKTGKLAWSISLVPKGEKPLPLGSSSVAYDGEMIYAAANIDPAKSITNDLFVKPLTQNKQQAILNAFSQQCKSTITALKAKTGAVKWQKTFEGAILASVSAANHVVFAAFFNGYFRALDAKTGAVLFEFRTGPVPGPFGLPPYNLSIPLNTTPVISDGRVFVGGGFSFPHSPEKTVPGGLFAFELSLDPQ